MTAEAKGEYRAQGRSGTSDCYRVWSNEGADDGHTLVCFFRGLSTSTLELLRHEISGVPRGRCQLVHTSMNACARCLLDVLHCDGDVCIDS